MTNGWDPAVVRSAYSSGANYLDRVALNEYQRPRTRFVEWVVGHAEFTGGDRVVDVGCGPGLYVRLLRRRPEQLRVVPIDQSTGMVREAGGGGLVGDAQRLPLTGAIADVVIAAHFLYHVADIPTAVAELRRIVRPDGVVLVTTNGPRHHTRVPEMIAAAGEVGAIAKPGHRFQLDTAAAHLEPMFGSVELDVIRSRIVLDDPEPMVRWIDSCEEFYAPALSVEWPIVLERVRAEVTAEVEERGTFEMETESGVFVCRP